MLSVRVLTASVLPLILFAVASCGEGSSKYAGLTRGEATTLAKARIESSLDPNKRAYYETSIWNIAAEHGKTSRDTPAWLIGIWNGQADRGDCALVSRSDGKARVQVVSCAAFPQYAR